MIQAQEHSSSTLFQLELCITRPSKLANKPDHPVLIVHELVSIGILGPVSFKVGEWRSPMPWPSSLPLPSCSCLNFPPKSVDLIRVDPTLHATAATTSRSKEEPIEEIKSVALAPVVCAISQLHSKAQILQCVTIRIEVIRTLDGK